MKTRNSLHFRYQNFRIFFMCDETRGKVATGDCFKFRAFICWCVMETSSSYYNSSWGLAGRDRESSSSICRPEAVMDSPLFLASNFDDSLQ